MVWLDGGNFIFSHQLCSLNFLNNNYSYLMIIWHESTVSFVQNYINKLTSNPQQSFPFLLIHWPSNIWKASALIELIKQYEQDSVMILEDLSQDWISLSENNDLAWQSHELTMEVKKEREIITKADWTRYRNYWVNDLRDRLAVSSSHGYKIVLIDNIDRMNDNATNSLLKMLEEPTPGQLIIATTSQLDSVMETITSRAFLFHTIWPSIDQVVEFMKWFHDYQQMLDWACWKIGRAIYIEKNLSVYEEIFRKIGSWNMPIILEWLTLAHANGSLGWVTDRICMKHQSLIPFVQQTWWYIKSNCNAQVSLLSLAWKIAKN